MGISATSEIITFVGVTTVGEGQEAGAVAAAVTGEMSPATSAAWRLKVLL